MLRAVTTMRLFGTFTSPYVRRVRIVAHELGLAHEVVDAATEEGQAALRSVNPLWKVPAVELDGEVIMDSGVINAHLMRTHGPGPLAALDPDDRVTRNACTVIDGVLDSLINGFYLAREGVTAEQVPYVRKQQERAVAGMAWLEEHVGDRWLTTGREFGVPEIALCTTVEWMRFRDTYPVERHAGLLRCVEHYAQRPSMVETRAPA